jgi:8-oxo-dGTP pyrophosphatase MutT (NUDIX family)
MEIERRGPFKVMSREIRHDRFGMQLVADKVQRPDGSLGEQFWVSFPNEAVLIFPMDADGNIYLSREFTYAANDYKIEAAGGTSDPGETLEDAAIRELREELGVEVVELHKIGTFQDITSRVDNRSHAYLAKVVNVGESRPDAGEDVRLEKLQFDTALDLVRRGVINTSVIAASIWYINDLLSTEAQEQR